MVGGQDAVNKLEKTQAVVNKANDVINKIENQARKVTI
jgi:Cu/Ag efflux protein CusF